MVLHERELKAWHISNIIIARRYSVVSCRARRLSCPPPWRVSRTRLKPGRSRHSVIIVPRQRVPREKKLTRSTTTSRSFFFTTSFLLSPPPSPPLPSLSKPAAPTDPLSWSESEVRLWLQTFQNGRYAALSPTFSNVNGRDFCFLTHTQMCSLVPGALGVSVFNNLRAVRKSYEVLKAKTAADKILQQHPSAMHAFPPLLYVPSRGALLSFLAFGVVSTLLLTVWSDSLKSRFGDDIVETIVTYGSIPLISCAFTFFHIWLALFMTFFPLNYIGIGWQIPGTNVGFPLGWQGIIPFKAEKMARMAVKLMTEQLIDVKVEFSKIDVKKMAHEMDGVILEKLATIINSTFERHQADLWAMLPADVREEVIVKGAEAGPDIVARIMDEVKEDILSVFDIEEFVVGYMTKNKALLNKVFIQCGWDELCFIRDCGAFLGGFFGFIQMLIWIPLHPDVKDPFLHPGWQSLSVFLGFGLVVGCATNWLALKIIFEPIEPINLGCYKLQGLFLKRQREISAVYGRITATEVLSAKNIIYEMLDGPNSPKLLAIIRRHLEDGCDEFVGKSMKPLIGRAIGGKMDAMRKEAIDYLLSDLHSAMLAAEEYTQKALDMENTLSSRMGDLPSAQFERLLHPVFEEDEWKLIVMGGVLGVVIGALQAFFIN